MISNRTQMLNSETTNIARHVKEQEKIRRTEYRVMIIAPRIHLDVADYFQYTVVSRNVRMLPLSIERTVGLYWDSDDIPALNSNYDIILQEIKDMSSEDFTDHINAYQFHIEHLN